MRREGWAVAPDGCCLRYRADQRDGAPWLLLSHAAGGSLEQWEATLPALADHFGVIRYDGRGHGLSGAPAGEYDVATLGRDALAVLATAGIGRAHVIGHSIGGMAGMWAAIHAPEAVDRLIVANSVAYSGAPDMFNGLIAQIRTGGAAAIADGFASAWISPPVQAARPELVAAVARGLRTMPVNGLIGSLAAVRDVDLRADLPRIASPVLVINGGDDVEGARMAGTVIRDAIAGAELVTIAGTAHMSPFEDPSRFNEEVVRFLAA